MKITNISPKTELIKSKDFKLYEDILTVDFKKIPAKQNSLAVIKIDFDNEEDLFVHSVVSCGCTKPKIFTLNVKEQAIEINFKPNSKGDFTKQMTLYDKTKGKKQIVKLTGTAI